MQNKSQPKPLEWVDIIDTKGRKSSLGVGGRTIPTGHLQVTGNLEHGAQIRPCTSADAKRLSDAVTGGAFSDLLEACKHSLGALRQLASNAGDVPEWNRGGVGYQACRALEAAIRKAEGR